MAKLYGQMFARSDITHRTGDLSQVAGIRLKTLSEGREDGVRIADVRSGSGLHFQVTLDRGMDISVAEHKGVALAWRSPAGDVHPAFFEPQEKGWLRTFPGGLLTGCGMTSAGAPCSDGGEEPGLHGRLSHLPATGVSATTRWAGTECVFLLQGTMRESSPFGENLVLHRSIEAFLGRSVIAVKDIVRNEGSARTPLMMLYHCNLGWPLIDEGAVLMVNALSTTPRDSDAAPGLATARQFHAPVAGYREQVFYHDLEADNDGFVTTLMSNPHLNLGLYIRYRQKELPRCVEWKMMGEGTYVVGIEPANCLVEGRDRERAAGTLQFLESGEQREFLLHIGVLEGKEELDGFVRKHRLRA